MWAASRKNAGQESRLDASGRAIGYNNKYRSGTPDADVGWPTAAQSSSVASRCYYIHQAVAVAAACEPAEHDVGPKLWDEFLSKIKCVAVANSGVIVL